MQTITKPEQISSSERQVPTLRRNFSWTFVGNTVYAATQWGMLALLAKLGGSPSLVGQFALAVAVATPVITFTNLALRQVQATDATHKYRFGDYLALRLLTSLIALMVIAGISLIGYPLPTAIIIIVMGVARAVEAVSDVYFGMLQQRERMDRIAISMILKGALSLVAFGALFAITGSVLAAVLGLTVAWTLVLLCYDIPSGALAGASEKLADAPVKSESEPAGLSDRPRPRWNRTTLWELTWRTLPLGFTMMIISLNANLPRYFVEGQIGGHELGIFAAMAYVLVAGTTVVSALSQATIPRLSKHFAAGNASAFRSLLLKNAGVAAVLGACCVLVALVAGRPLLTLLYRPEYAQYTREFVWLNIAGMLYYISSAFAAGVTASQQYKVQPFLYGAACLATLIACIFLIPRYKLLGATWAFGVPAVVQIVGVLFCNAHALQTMRQHQENAPNPVRRESRQTI